MNYQTYVQITPTYFNPEAGGYRGICPFFSELLKKLGLSNIVKGTIIR